jgi:hypothetical protein
MQSVRKGSTNSLTAGKSLLFAQKPSLLNYVVRLMIIWINMLRSDGHSSRVLSSSAHM